MARKRRIVEVADKLISFSDSVQGLGDKAKENGALFKNIQQIVEDFEKHDRRGYESSLTPEKFDNVRNKNRNRLIAETFDQVKVVFQQLTYEFSIAREIQQNLLPTSELNIGGYTIAGFNKPSQMIGGDLFDYFPINSDKLFFGIGDVAGKGVSASLLMATFNAYVKAKIESDIPLQTLMYETNNFICQNSPADKFVTFFCGIIDCKKGSLEYVNAGHNPPVLVDNKGKLSYIEAGGPILGVVPKTVYNTAVITLKNIHELVAYTDGITEATNGSDGMFGEERLVNLLTSHLSSPPREIVEAVFEAVDNFSDGNEYGDDLTILIMQNMSSPMMLEG